MHNDAHYHDVGGKLNNKRSALLFHHLFRKVEPDNFPVPECLVRFFTGVLLGDCIAANPSPRIQLLVNSFSQDLIYATSVAKAIPPKHILLSYGVKTLTENVELIQMLNRFEHGVSYCQLQKNDKALCLKKMAANLNP